MSDDIDFDSLDLEGAINIIKEQQNIITDLRDIVKYYQSEVSALAKYLDRERNNRRGSVGVDK